MIYFGAYIVANVILIIALFIFARKTISQIEQIQEGLLEAIDLLKLQTMKGKSQ